MTPVSSAANARSPKRGIAYNLAAAAADYAAVSPGVSWWYTSTTLPNAAVPINVLFQYDMDYGPMLWNDQFNDAQIAPGAAGASLRGLPDGAERA